MIQIQIYCALIKLWSSPASTIADQLGRERTSTYKLMKQMVELGYLTQSMRHGAAVFTHIPLETLKCIRDHQVSQTMYVSDHYDIVAHEYEQMSVASANIPRITISQWINGLSHTFDLMEQLIIQYGLIRMTCIASLTFESLGSRNPDLDRLMSKFQSILSQHKVSVDGYYATGMSLMEQLRTHLWPLEDLPTSNDAVSLWIIADHVIVIMMQSQPQIITIQSRLYADLLLFVAGQLPK
jgi:Sugar-specific transcriptional regulator TrmB